MFCDFVNYYNELHGYYGNNIYFLNNIDISKAFSVRLAAYINSNSVMQYKTYGGMKVGIQVFNRVVYETFSPSGNKDWFNNYTLTKDTYYIFGVSKNGVEFFDKLPKEYFRFREKIISCINKNQHIPMDILIYYSDFTQDELSYSWNKITSSMPSTKIVVPYCYSDSYSTKKQYSYYHVFTDIEPLSYDVFSSLKEKVSNENTTIRYIPSTNVMSIESDDVNILKRIKLFGIKPSITCKLCTTYVRKSALSNLVKEMNSCKMRCTVV